MASAMFEELSTKIIEDITMPNNEIFSFFNKME